MEFKLVCVSHSPLIYFPGRETSDINEMRVALSEVKSHVEAFDPQLIVMFGSDHYGGHQMASMPAFCVGVEATALADVGGTPGKLQVPRQIAVDCVKSLRNDNIDVAVSYAMEVDHGFSQALQEIAGGVASYPVLPIFVSCLQPPFVPFKRARALGSAVAGFLATLGLERILILGTGGLSHNPEQLFPAIDDVSDEWRPYHLLGKRQDEVSQQKWMTFEIDMHHMAAGMLARGEIPAEALKISDIWDRAFLDLLENGDISVVDDWTAEAVIEGGGFGAMEILTWIAATQAMESLTGKRPHTAFYRAIPEVGIGFGIAETTRAARF